MLRKGLTWLALAFLGFYAITHPTSAAHAVATVVSGLGSFFAALAGSVA